MHRNDPLSVSEISALVKQTLERGLDIVQVRGEIGRVVRATSGHIYVDLKDDRAVLSGVIWRTQVATISLPLETGNQVIATGRISSFAGQSKYQLVIQDLVLDGLGALMATLEKRKAKLQAEGLFAPERKQALPYLPALIGIVTSPQGAALQDILGRLRTRFPCSVVVWPSLVQGDEAAPQIVQAIRGFNQLPKAKAVENGVQRPDVVIVARGGGSLEDLWVFNDESIVRAVADSEIPIVSAIGHEIDTTLIDWAADVRAPTPTAAAEMVVPVRADCVQNVALLAARLQRGIDNAVRTGWLRLDSSARALPRTPRMITEEARQRLDLLTARLQTALTLALAAKRAHLGRTASRLSVLHLHARAQHERAHIARAGDMLAIAMTRHRERAQVRLDTAVAVLHSLDYRATLQRGFAVVRAKAGARVLSNAGDVRTAGRIAIELMDGHVTAEVQQTTGLQTTPKHSMIAQKKKGQDDQGNLF